MQMFVVWERTHGSADAYAATAIVPCLRKAERWARACLNDAGQPATEAIITTHPTCPDVRPSQRATPPNRSQP